MKLIYNALSRWPDYARLEGAVAGGALPAAVTGLSGIHKCCVIASLCQKTGRRALVLAADEAEAQRFCEDLRALGLRPLPYPLRDFGFRDAAGTSHEYERLRLVSHDVRNHQLTMQILRSKGEHQLAQEYAEKIDQKIMEALK